MLFCCFEAFCGIFTENFSYYSKNWLSLNRAQKYSESLFFLTNLKRSKSFGKLDWFKQLFLIKPVKWGKSLKKNFFLYKVSHILYFFVVLKHIGENSQRISLFIQKSGYLRKEHWNTQKFVFLNKFEKGQILRKICICLNNW